MMRREGDKMAFENVGIIKERILVSVDHQLAVGLLDDKWVPHYRKALELGAP